MLKFIFLVPAILFLNMSCIAQQKIVLLNGNIIETKEFVVKFEKITFKKNCGKGEKKGSLDKFRVFSIIKPDGTEQIIYEPDTTVDLSIDQMRIYIEGEQAAIKY